MANDVGGEADLGLEALLQSAADGAPDLDEGFLRKVYLIEKARQFDRARDVSLQELERAVEDEVERLLGLEATP